MRTSVSLVGELQIVRSQFIVFCLSYIFELYISQSYGFVRLRLRYVLTMDLWLNLPKSLIRYYRC